MSAARDHLAAIASAPRPAGGEAESKARDYCAGVLRAQGFEISDHAFEYSTVVGEWGTPLFGMAMAALLVVAANQGLDGSGARALGVLVLGALLLGALGSLLAKRGVLDIPFARARGTNLFATRGAPTLWLVAHLDSKSQPIPIMVRALAIMASMIILGVAMGVAVAQLFVPMPDFVWPALTAAELLAALPVMASVVGARSAGALDNASGVATVLRVAELLSRDASIGVLLTSAEELGLAGARAWAREMPAQGAPLSAINIDGVDDMGDVRLIYSGRLPSAMIERLGNSWPKPVKLVPGVLMDGIALSDAGWDVINISKGGWTTVARIHTPRDGLAQLNGSGAEALASLLAGAIAASPR